MSAPRRTRPAHVCPAVRQIGDPDDGWWELVEPIAHGDVVVPVGTRFDFASTPRLAWSLVGHPESGGTCPPGVHDWLYRHGGAPPGVARPYTRAAADALLLTMLRAHGVGRARARLWYLGVRLGGGAAWNA
jgi:hypothetical protein